MSDDYTPTTEEVREAFWAGASGADMDFDDRYYPMFDRWLAKHDASIASQAWEVGYGHDDDCRTPRTNPYLNKEN